MQCGVRSQHYITGHCETVGPGGKAIISSLVEVGSQHLRIGSRAKSGGNAYKVRGIIHLLVGHDQDLLYKDHHWFKRLALGRGTDDPPTTRWRTFAGRSAPSA